MFRTLRAVLALVCLSLLVACGGGGGGSGGSVGGVASSSSASSSLGAFTCPAGTAASTADFALSTNAIHVQAVAGSTVSTGADVMMLSITNPANKVFIEYEGLWISSASKAGGGVTYTVNPVALSAGTHCGYVVYTAKNSGGAVLSTVKVAVQVDVKKASPISTDPAYVCPGASSSNATSDFSLTTVKVALTGTAGVIGTASSETVFMSIFNGSVAGIRVTKVVPEVDWLIVTINEIGGYASVSAFQEFLNPGTYCAVVNVAVTNAGGTVLSSRDVAVKLVLAASASSSSAASSVSNASSSSTSSSGGLGGSASSSSSVTVSSSSSVASISSSASSVSVQAYPGTGSNPVLSVYEAGLLGMSNYLLYGPSGMDTWSPLLSVPDCATATCLNVGSGQTYSTIQAAVQAAIGLSGANRVYIRVAPGTYAGPVIVPNVSGAPPISIIGSSSNASDVRVAGSIVAGMTGASYNSAFSSLFASTDHAYASFNSCASKSGSIGTTCSAVFWTRSANIQIANLTVENTTAHTSGVGQAVAFESEGDKTYLYNVRLISRQDTLYLKTPSVGTIARVYVANSYVEGDVDYVFGRATAVFEGVTFKSMSDRSTTSYVFAPSTAPGVSYGFHVINSTFTTDGGFGGNAQLGRSWDEGASAGYVPGSSPNGQLVIRDSSISGDFKGATPWAAAATTNRAYSGNINTSRSLDDSSYNRFWQYNNTGAGAL